jgi:hypothetical protein
LIVDIAGARALKERRGQKGADEAPPAPAADVPEDAPPVYHWLGIPQPRETLPEEDTASNVPLLHRSA